jgi:hypothetical protein
VATETHALQAIRLAPTDDPTHPILFRRDGGILVMAGQRSELARIVGGAIKNLAQSAWDTKGSVTKHVHLDPTSDPEHRWYSSESISLVVYLEDDDLE